MTTVTPTVAQMKFKINPSASGTQSSNFYSDVPDALAPAAAAAALPTKQADRWLCLCKPDAKLRGSDDRTGSYQRGGRSG